MILIKRNQIIDIRFTLRFRFILSTVHVSFAKTDEKTFLFTLINKTIVLANGYHAYEAKYYYT